MPFSTEMILGASGNQGAAAFYEYQIEQSARFDLTVTHIFLGHL